jgi:hypothetical protein
MPRTTTVENMFQGPTGANILSQMPVRSVSNLTQTSAALNVAAANELAARKTFYQQLETHILANTVALDDIAGWGWGPVGIKPKRSHRGTITRSNARYGVFGPNHQFAHVNPWKRGTLEQYLETAKRMGFNVVHDELGSIIPDFTADNPRVYVHIGKVIDAINHAEHCIIKLVRIQGNDAPRLQAWDKRERELYESLVRESTHVD